MSLNHFVTSMTFNGDELQLLPAGAVQLPDGYFNPLGTCAFLLRIKNNLDIAIT
jgi:hypothetical protein